MDGLRHIPLTLTSNYASSWGLWEGVRELVQNWHDGLYEMVDSLNVVSSTPLPMEFKKFVGLQVNTEFEAFVKNPADQSEILLGTLIFDGLNNRLTLINKSTSLHKRILLMGYSAKTTKKEVIGQFGEGLKVGALSLVRDGRPVTMETSTDRWRFDLVHNKEFGEKVLTVEVSDRTTIAQTRELLADDSFPSCPRELAASDTCTTVSNVRLEEWKELLPKFLFLNPPVDSVKTELGTLLLDAPLAGQLYVKGVWVSDLREEDLAAGVDFTALQLDRDRNAVPRPSEIDHLVSCIWIKAVTQKPSLLAKYYNLLLSDKYRDVRHAALYVSDTSIPQMISALFSSTHGKDTVPVLNTISMDKLQQIRRELTSKVVLCNQTLMNILTHSGNHVSVDEALLVLRSHHLTKVPYSSLNEEQQNILRHAEKLIQMADKTFSLAAVDIIQTANYENGSASGDRITIPMWLLDSETVHSVARFCSEEATLCMCREAWICSVVLELRKDKLPKCRVHPSSSDLLELTNQVRAVNPTQPVVALLAMESCYRITAEFCVNLHPRTQGEVTGISKTLQAEFVEREQKYLQKIQDLETQLEEQVRENVLQLGKLKVRLESTEKELMSREISLVDAEEAIRRHCEQRIKQAQAQAEESERKYQKVLREIQSQMTDLRTELQYKDTLISDHKKQAKQNEEASRRKQENLQEELLHYIQKHRARTEHLAAICEAAPDDLEPEVKVKCQRLAELCDVVLQELQSEKFLCAVCKMRRKDSILQPCGHYVYCGDCARTMVATIGRCPICTLEADTSQIVYE